jgi:hypothetical protein
VLELARSIMDTELLFVLAVKTLCPTSTNAMIKGVMGEKYSYIH